MTTTSPAPLSVADLARSLAAEAVSLTAHISELRGTLALLDVQMQSVSDALRQLRAAAAEKAPASPHPCGAP
ncbi:hypothetical protein [Streptomyces sp. NPDC096311]|uniref:hypothetical protein n=1 Tax=Streptomyces sp. NPDC096311 TaxID=3366083 RepID=UPI00381ADCEF